MGIIPQLSQADIQAGNTFVCIKWGDQCQLVPPTNATKILAGGLAKMGTILADNVDAQGPSPVKKTGKDIALCSLSLQTRRTEDKLKQNEEKFYRKVSCFPGPRKEKFGKKGHECPTKSLGAKMLSSVTSFFG